MPRVPAAYDLPEVSLTPGQAPNYAAPKAQPPIDASAVQTEQLGRALQSAGTSVVQTSTALQADYDQAKAREADNLVRDLIQRKLHDPKDGYLNVYGKAAVGARRKQTFDEIDSGIADIGQQLQNQNQRNLVHESVADRMLAAHALADDHEARETKSYNLAETQTRMNVAGEDALAAYGTPAFELEKGIMLREGNAMADQLGLAKDDAQRAQILQSATTKLHSNVVQSLLTAQRPDQARTYLQDPQVKKEIIPSRAVALQQMVQQGSIHSEGADVAAAAIDEVVKNHQDTIPDGGWLDPHIATQESLALIEQKRAAGKISAEVADNASARVRQKGMDWRQTENDLQKNTLDRATQWLIDNPKAGVAQLPPDLSVDAKRLGLMGHINAFADSNGRYTTDPQKFAEMLNTPDSVMRSKLPGEWELQWRPVLSDKELGIALAQHAKAVGTSTREQTDLLSHETRLREAAVRAGVIKNREGMMTDLEASHFYQFRQDVENRLGDFETAVKRKATPAELQKQVDEATMDKAYEDVFGSDPLLPVGSMTDEERKSAYVMVGDERINLGPTAPSVPASERAKIVDKLRQRGWPVTEQAIAEFWVAAGKPMPARPK